MNILCLNVVSGAARFVSCVKYNQTETEFLLIPDTNIIVIPFHADLQIVVLGNETMN